MPAPIEVPPEVHMESSDHMEYLEEKVVQMLAQNEFLTNTLVGIVDKLDRLMQTQNPILTVLENRPFSRILNIYGEADFI